MTTADFRRGLCLNCEGQYYYIMEFLHVKPGKGSAFVRTKLRHVITSSVIERTFNAGVKIEEARIERHCYQFLYRDDIGYHFMNNETYDQISVFKKNIIGVDFLKEGSMVEALICVKSGTVLLVELPNYVILSVTYTELGIKGNTVTNSTKSATLETGAIVRVPLFINEGEKVRIDIRDGSYVERAK